MIIELISRNRHGLAGLLLFAITVNCQAQHGWAAADAITLDECPPAYGGYSAEPIIENYAVVGVKVFYDGSLWQELRPENEEDRLAMPADEENADKLIHFPDANNDGYRDLFVGPGGSRSQNTLYLWNPKTTQFELCKSANNPQNILFCPQENAIYQGGSNSAWEFGISRYEWKGMTMHLTASLEITNNIDDYNKNAAVTHRKIYPYVLRVVGGKITRARNITQLPKNWQRAIGKIMP